MARRPLDPVMPETQAALGRPIRGSTDRIGRDDPRYTDLSAKRFNKRYRGNPDYVLLPGSTEQVVEAVQEAVRERLRVAARSGGHCMEGFVADPAVRVVIDTSLMNAIYYDPDMDAFAVEAGATVGEMVRKLCLGWGVLVPAGESPEIGVGGHVLGGAFGFLCREHGLAADHLYAVEVVVVDAEGSAASVIATREPSDPNHDLWWAHTGGGGGNFGIVTRYWFRSPGAVGSNPTRLLPRVPDSVLTFRMAWEWEDVDQTAFMRLARNFGTWSEEHSEPGSPYARLFSTLFLWRRQAGKLEVRGLSTAGAEADRLVREHVGAISDGVGAPHTLDLERSSWLAFALDPFPELFRAGPGDASLKAKDAFLRRRLSDRPLEIAHDYLTRADHDVPGGMLGFVTYGGQVNAVAPDATASAQRDCVLSMSCMAGWQDPGDEPRMLDWVRGFYRDLFADTGGVPVPGELADGAMINHPDTDLADPKWNTSGVPWHALYYKGNYPRLQRAKARWDPGDVFHHALSIRVT